MFTQLFVSTPSPTAGREQLPGTCVVVVKLVVLVVLLVVVEVEVVDVIVTVVLVLVLVVVVVTVTVVTVVVVARQVGTVPLSSASALKQFSVLLSPS